MTIPLHTVPGEELPDLLWYHREEEDPTQLTARFRPPLFDGWSSKPEGGLWTAVMRDFYGPQLSAWGNFEDNVQVKGHQYVTRLAPNPTGRFLVVDSHADAAAIAQAFPGVRGRGTLHKLLADAGEPVVTIAAPELPDPDLDGVPEHLHEALLGFAGDSRRPLVDFTLLAQHQYDGLYLTDRGRMETKDTYGLPAGVPSFWGWDVETVWFRVPDVRVLDTRRWEPV